MKVRFTAPYSYVPSMQPRVTIVFDPRGGDGHGRYTVKRECGEAAIAAGKAVELRDEAAETSPDAAPDTPEA